MQTYVLLYDRLLEVLDSQDIKKGIFVYDGKLTPAAQKVSPVATSGTD